MGNRSGNISCGSCNGTIIEVAVRKEGVVTVLVTVIVVTVVVAVILVIHIALL